MIYANRGDFKDPLKQDLAFEFCANQNKDLSILTGTHTNHDEIHHKRNNWLGPIFFSPGHSHKKGLIVLLHPDLEDVTEVDTDPEERFVFFKVNLSNDRVLCVYVPSGHNTREQQAVRHFFEDYKIISKIKLTEVKTTQYLKT